MDIFKIIAVGLVTTVCAVILKQVKPELAIFAGIAGALIIIYLILQAVGVVFQDYKSILDKTGVNSSIFTSVLKIIGIGYIVEFCGSLCAEAGVKIVADRIMFAGKVLILIMCMPVVRNLIEIVIKLVP